MGSTGGSQLEIHHMKPSRKTNWIRCPECGGKTRTQVREHTLLEDFPLFCPKCHCEYVIAFRNGKIQNIQMPDAMTQSKA